MRGVNISAFFQRAYAMPFVCRAHPWDSCKQKLISCLLFFNATMKFLSGEIFLCHALDTFLGTVANDGELWWLNSMLKQLINI